ncbi:MAG: hypothetical protein EPO10_08565 [Reyranella sp.]|uniref:hypothetical protein n=1 Tax=Reyranella sp. TaxID=1929291 RepID=UPI001218570F|nr:hypothetical protein [Reyranella sp.]TAJ87896.1 MAG: hypothetical protein EPO41_22540 [Reyranella sp.]TBR29314.1 MAG: hypothetical protein EPO10_08565 [Reyranella sp.]
MTQDVVIIGHADADGHLITEQVRRNLARIDRFKVTAIVDPSRTRDHKAWLNLDAFPEVLKADIVFFVDLMFAPASFAQESQALVDFVGRYPEKKFFLFDHHPLPLRRLEAARNLRVIYRPDVFECAIGPRSGMMVVAALCEKQRRQVADITTERHELIAEGMRRAAALGGNLPGEKLLALLRADHWRDFVELAQEAREEHRLPRGRRPAGKQSPVLDKLERTASKLLGTTTGAKLGSTTMSYDFDVTIERYSYESGRRQSTTNKVSSGRDLEAIITLLEVAALSLTTEEGATFSREHLIREAREIGGPEIDLRDEDIDIVLQKQGFLARVGRELRLR